MPETRRHRLPALGVALALAAAACGPGGSERPPDIVLVSIDTLRADHVATYGAERPTTPTLDSLAAEGALFENVAASSSWTLPSHVSLLTGMSVASHRVHSIVDRIDPARRLLAEHLVANGYHAAAFVSAPFLHRAYGFAQGFSVYRNRGVGPVAADALPTPRVHRESHADRTAASVVEDALAWLARQPVDGAPVFLFVHLWDPHYDYDPPPPWDTAFDPEYRGDLDASDFGWNPSITPDMPPRDLRHLIALYDGEIRWTDEQLARLLAALARRGTAERTLVSVVSDHGEEFFEHGRKGHMKTLFDEVVRVPWIVRYPPRVAPGMRLARPASLEDVAPTLLDLAGLPPLPEATGVSYAADLEGRPSAERPALLVLGEIVALRGRDWKVLRTETGNLEYYDLVADPAERAPRPASEAAPAAVRALAERLRADHAHAASLPWTRPGPAELDAATRARLRELGYVGSPPDS